MLKKARFERNPEYKVNDSMIWKSFVKRNSNVYEWYLPIIIFLVFHAMCTFHIHWFFVVTFLMVYVKAYLSHHFQFSGISTKTAFEATFSVPGYFVFWYVLQGYFEFGDYLYCGPLTSSFKWIPSSWYLYKLSVARFTWSSC